MGERIRLRERGGRLAGIRYLEVGMRGDFCGGCIFQFFFPPVGYEFERAWCKGRERKGRVEFVQDRGDDGDQGVEDGHR